MPSRPRLPDVRRVVRSLLGRGAGGLRDRSAPEWLRQPGVHGVGIARKTLNRRPTRDLGITVFVEEKLPLQDIAVPVPREVEHYGLGEPIVTDVVAIGRASLHAPNAGSLAPGCAVSRMQHASGTFGCVVTRRESAELHLLTAGHVLATAEALQGDPVLHPGFEDGGRPPINTLATLASWTDLSVTADGYPNFADAAISRLVEPNAIDPTIPGIGKPSGRTNLLRIGTPVQMVGRVSGYQQATVMALDFSIEFTMSLPNGQFGRVGFSDLVLCTRYGAQGDSGAAVLNMNGQLVGVHMGGTDTTSFFCRAGNVFAALDIELPQ